MGNPLASTPPPSAVPSTPVTAPVAPAATPVSLQDRIDQLVATTPDGAPDGVVASPTQVVGEPGAPVAEPDATSPSTPSELVDDEDFKLSWEEDELTTPPPPVAPETPTPAAEKLTAEGLEEIKSYLTEQLNLPESDTERLWGKLLQLPRARKSLEAYKTLRDLEKPWEEGGVGYIPTTEAVRSLVQSKIAYQDLVADLTSGDPTKTADAWSFIFAPGVSENGAPPQLRPGIEAALPQLPELLFKSGGQALYNTVAKPVIENFMNHLYDAGEQAIDPKEKEWLTNTARGIDWRVNKTWRKTASANGHAEPTSTERPPQDPRLTDELRRSHERIRELEGGRLNNFKSSIESDETTILNTGLDEALAVAKEIYPEHVYNAIRKDFAVQVRNSLSSNPVFQREYEQLLARVYQTGSPADHTQLVAKFRQQAGSSIKRFRTQFLKSIKSTTAERRTEADKDRLALGQVQNKVGPTSTGQSARQQVSALEEERPAGTSSRDWLTQRIEKLTSAASQSVQ